jgi:glycosyltransferase involved in cell wall biosynthesis
MPRVTFGVIVLNGEPFNRYCLRAIYPFAHQIVVAEGASPAASDVARSDGHSSDGTLDAIGAFRSEEDPEGKIELVFAEDEGYPDGFWPGEKLEQSRAWARRATGDWIWAVDIDEFYHPEDMERVLAMLSERPGVAAVSFPQLQFWGGFDYVAEGWYLRRRGGVFHRLFRWRPGYRYAAHRPPTVEDEQGVNLRRRGWVRGRTMARAGILLHHYSLVFPKQVEEKARYYQGGAKPRRERSIEWYEKAYRRLEWRYHAHNVYHFPSWLRRFRGTHPPEVERMRADMRAGRLCVRERGTADVERLLESRRYRLGRWGLRLLDPVDRAWRLAGRALRWIAGAARAEDRAVGS